MTSLTVDLNPSRGKHIENCRNRRCRNPHGYYGLRELKCGWRRKKVYGPDNKPQKICNTKEKAAEFMYFVTIQRKGPGARMINFPERREEYVERLRIGTFPKPDKVKKRNIKNSASSTSPSMRLNTL